MKKSGTEKENERLKKALERKKMEIKKIKQQVKYAKDTKNGLNTFFIVFFILFLSPL